MRARTEAHASQIAQMRIVSHLGDERVSANGEIGEWNCLWTHKLPIQHIDNAEQSSIWIVYRTNPVVNPRDPDSARKPRIQLTNKFGCIRGFTAEIERFAMLR